MPRPRKKTKSEITKIYENRINMSKREFCNHLHDYYLKGYSAANMKWLRKQKLLQQDS